MASKPSELRTFQRVRLVVGAWARLAAGMRAAAVPASAAARKDRRFMGPLPGEGAGALFARVPRQPVGRGAGERGNGAGEVGLIGEAQVRGQCRDRSVPCAKGPDRAVGALFEAVTLGAGAISAAEAPADRLR